MSGLFGCTIYRIRHSAIGLAWARRLARFGDDRRGFVAMAFALTVMPLIMTMGAAVDFSTTFQARTKLNAAADAAALAAVSKSIMKQSSTYAQSTATTVFNAAMYGVKAVTNASVTANVVDGATGRTANLSYTATVPTSFMGVVGVRNITVNGSATAAAPFPPFIDFYLLLDNTPSMGVGATPTDVATMVNNTPDQCAFACHDISAGSNDYYSLAKRLGVTMRIDVVRTATQQLMDTATSLSSVANQFRMAIYTFGASADAIGLTTISALTTDLAGSKTAANAIDLMSVPYQGYNNDQFTNYESIMGSLNNAITSSGDGTTSAAPQKIVFLVSDGVGDSSNPSNCSRATTNGRCQAPISTALCTTLKNKGIKIAVLYTTYLPLPTNAWYNSWIAPFQSAIPTNMQGCASPGLYFEVSPTQGIGTAMNTLFQQAVAQARLTR